VNSSKRCISETKLLCDANTKPQAGYRMVPVSMTLREPSLRFQGRSIFSKSNMSKTVQDRAIVTIDWT